MLAKVGGVEKMAKEAETGLIVLFAGTFVARG
jgi:hypothetical protein